MECLMAYQRKKEPQMIEIETRQFAEHSLLHAFPEGKRVTPLPTIVFYHGFTSSNLVYSYFAVALAQAGFRVTMQGALDHGECLKRMTQERIVVSWQTL